MIYVDNYKWTVPSDENVIATQGEFETNSVEITMDRYTDSGKDKADGYIYIEYVNSEGAQDECYIDSDHYGTNEDTIVISWVVDRGATIIAGSLTVTILVQWLGSDEVTAQWCSNEHVFTVNETLNRSDSMEVYEAVTNALGQALTTINSTDVKNDLSKRLMAYLANKGGTNCVFDYTNKKLTLCDNIIFCRGTHYTLSSKEISFSSITTTGQAYNILVSLTMDSNGKFPVVVKAWTDSYAGYAYLGYIYGTHCYINGVDEGNISVLVNNKESSKIIAIANDLRGRLEAYFLIGNGKYCVVDYTNKTITFPSATIHCRGTNFSIAEKTIDYSSVDTTAEAYTIVVSTTSTSDGNIYPIIVLPWYQSYSGYVYLGYIYGKNCFINGVDSINIKVLNNGSDESDFGKIRTDLSGRIIAYLANKDGTYCTYDYRNKTITMSSDIIFCRGKYFTLASKKIDFSDIEDLNAAYLIVVSTTKTEDNKYPLVVKPWNETYYGQVYLGYIYNTHVEINGVDNDNIRIIKNVVGFFGDSIIAGVGSTFPFHQWWQRWSNATCLNYGVGSSGYYVGPASSNHTIGLGVEGQGASMMFPGTTSTTTTAECTVEKVMKYWKENGADLDRIVIATGSNDWSENVVLDDSYKEIVGSAIQYAIDWVGSDNVLIGLPIKRNTGYSENTNGNTLLEFSNAIKEVCDSKGVLYWEGYSIPFDPNDEISKATYFADGSHPSIVGHELMAAWIYEKFTSVTKSATRSDKEVLPWFLGKMAYQINETNNETIVLLKEVSALLKNNQIDEAANAIDEFIIGKGEIS